MPDRARHHPSFNRTRKPERCSATGAVPTGVRDDINWADRMAGWARRLPDRMAARVRVPGENVAREQLDALTAVWALSDSYPKVMQNRLAVGSYVERVDIGAAGRLDVSKQKFDGIEIPCL
jgi:hypothetical protein